MNDLFEKLIYSKFQYYSGHVVNQCLIVWLIYQGSLSFSGFDKEIILLYALGALNWPLIEYVFHKFLYHKNTGPFMHGHDLHHQKPRELSGIPWYFYIPVLIGIFFVLKTQFASTRFALVFAGVWSGYYSYTVMHHAVHHWNFKWSWFRKLKKHHDIHHTLPAFNIGVTSTIWDWILGTKYLKKSERKA